MNPKLNDGPGSWWCVAHRFDRQEGVRDTTSNLTMCNKKDLSIMKVVVAAHLWCKDRPCGWTRTARRPDAASFVAGSRNLLLQINNVQISCTYGGYTWSVGIGPNLRICDIERHQRYKNKHSCRRATTLAWHTILQCQAMASRTFHPLAKTRDVNISTTRGGGGCFQQWAYRRRWPASLMARRSKWQGKKRSEPDWVSDWPTDCVTCRPT